MAQRLRAEGRRATLVVLSDIQGSGGDVHHSHSATFKNHNHKDQWIDVPLPLTSSLARSDSVDGLGQSIDVGCEGPVLSQNWIESTGSIRRYTARFDVTLFVVDDRLAAGVEVEEVCICLVNSWQLKFWLGAGGPLRPCCRPHGPLRRLPGVRHSH